MFCKCCQDNKFLKQLNKLAQNRKQKTSLDGNNKSQTQLLGPMGLGAVSPSNNIYIDSLSWGGSKWNWSQGSSNKLTYSFAPSYEVGDCPSGVTSLNYPDGPIKILSWEEDEKNAMRTGLQKWTDIIGMGIEEVTATNQGDENNADLRFYITTDDNFSALGAQYGPHTNPYQGIGIYKRYSGNIWTDSLQPGGFGYITIIHELGHAMGLAHPHDNGGQSYGASSNGLFPGVSNNADKGDNDLNQNTFTVMSYIDVNSGINPSSYQQYGFCMGPMAFDIAAMEHLYGLSDNFNNGDNVYTITEGTVGGVDGYTCIYDSGGTDLIIYNGNNIVIIDLRAATIQNEPGGGGFISKVDQSSIYSGFSIANGGIIENATGGTNDDTIYQVDSVSNVIDGNTGIDTVIYQSDSDIYTIRKNFTGDGSYITVSNGSATDILYNIERLQFQDKILDTSSIFANLNSTYLSNISTPISINNSNPIITHDIVITDNPNQIVSLEVLLKNIQHTWVGDLLITLTNLNTNSEIILTNLSGSGIYGSSANNFVDVILSDDGNSDINNISNTNNISGTYYPSNNGTRTSLSLFNNQVINSTWRLKITDTYPAADNGQLIEWGLKFNYFAIDEEDDDDDNEETTSEYSSSPELVINNSNRVVTDDIVIDDNGQSVLDLVVVINDLEHTYVGDIKMTLTKIDVGVSLILMNLAGSGTFGSSGENLVDLVLTDEASESIDSISSGNNNYTGEYKPSDNETITRLSSFDGLDINGTWRLQIEDTYPSADNGTLKKWSLRIKHNQVNQSPIFVSISAPDGQYKEGENIEITVTWNQPVLVSGNPQLSLSNGAMANYSSGTGSESLVFNYIISSGDNDTGDLLVSNYVGTISNSDGNPAENINNKDLGNVIIDTTAPGLESVTATDGTYTVDQSIQINVTWSENVFTNESSPPQLNLSNGAIANYASGSGSQSLVFNYNISSGDDSSDLKVSNYTGTIADSAGNLAQNLSNEDLGSVIIDTTAPGFVSLSAPEGTYTLNQTVEITVSWDENVQVNGVPQLNLSNDAVATYNSGSGSQSLVFNYNVSSGQDTSSLRVSNYTGTITDSAQNPAENFSDQDPGNVIINTTAPEFVSVSVPTGTYTVNQTIQITVSWDENVSISENPPQLNFVDGSNAPYKSGSGSPNLVFEYTISNINSSDSDPNKSLLISNYSGKITGSGELDVQQIPTNTNIGDWKLHVS